MQTYKKMETITQYIKSSADGYFWRSSERESWAGPYKTKQALYLDIIREFGHLNNVREEANNAE